MTNWPQLTIDTDRSYSLCFGCGQNNPIGLKLSFHWDGKTAKAEFTPTEFYQGWPGQVHGGILTCILDEAMSWAVLSEGVNCVTAKIQVNLRRPASIDEPLVIISSITRKTRKVAETKAMVALRDGTLIAEGTAKHFIADSPEIKDKPGSDTQ
ncbi:PaaI family thioesterase [Chloroflexota bacterium]